MVLDAGRRSKALASACEIIEADAQARVTGNVTLDRRRPLDVLTRFGWVRLMRWYQRDSQSEGYHYPLDAVLRLTPRQHASPWVIQQAAALAAQLSYREAAEFLSGYLGTNVDHRTLHSLVSQPPANPSRTPGAPGAIPGRRPSRTRQKDQQPSKPKSTTDPPGAN